MVSASSVSNSRRPANAGAYLAGTNPDAAAEAFDAISEAADQTRVCSVRGGTARSIDSLRHRGMRQIACNDRDDSAVSGV
jgi:hypothetical protein